MHKFRILRLCSTVIDYLIVIGVFALLMYALWGFQEMGYIYLIVLPWYAYNVITSIIFKGATLGQFICGIKSISINEEEINVFVIFWLQLIRILYVVPFIFIPMLIQEFASYFLPDFKNLEQYITRTKFVIKTVVWEEELKCQ